MTVPTYQNYYPYILKFADEPKTSDDYLSLICEEMKISEEDQQVRNQSGEPTARNRLRWAIHYLRHAKLMDKPTRGKYVITERGKQVREDCGLDISNKTLEQFNEYLLFTKRKPKNQKTDLIGVSDMHTPTEKIESAYDNLIDETKVELRNQIFDLSPYFFEKMVLDLLTKMGYGNFEGTRVTSKSRDGGVDGIVYQDRLGLEMVYVQAKRNQEGNNIGRADLQKFYGSLGGMKASKGVFFTCSDFTADALDYLKTIPQKIICINGDKLLNLLLEFKIGVELEAVYETYKIDEDYFSE